MFGGEEKTCKNGSLLGMDERDAGEEKVAFIA